MKTLQQEVRDRKSVTGTLGGGSVVLLGLLHNSTILRHCLHAALLLGTWAQPNNRLLPPPDLPLRIVKLCLIADRAAVASRDIGAR